MKILTGELKGQRIFNQKVSESLRPTSDKVRKAVFDTLQGAVEDKKVLDLFGGTGALGIEALSQGAKQATFVEMDRLRALKIEENLKRLGLQSRSRVITEDVLKAVRHMDNEVFDLIFLDPPYERDLSRLTLEALDRSALIGPGSIVIAESHRKEKLPVKLTHLENVKSKCYGDTQILFYKFID